jgi:hypothetical protein
MMTEFVAHIKRVKGGAKGVPSLDGFEKSLSKLALGANARELPTAEEKGGNTEV